MIHGEGDYRYEEIRDWAQLPEGWVFAQVSDAAVDSKGRIYAFTRGVHPIVVFDKDGNFVTSWGYGDFGISPNLVSQSHGIFITPDDKVYLTDTFQHIVRRYDRLGELEREWGTRGVPGPSFHRREYNMPTGVAFAPDGQHFYVSDGYGSRCVHKYDSNGKHIHVWGEGGGGRISVWSADGELICRFEDKAAIQSPHGLCVDHDGNIYVAEIGIEGQGQRLQKFARV